MSPDAATIGAPGMSVRSFIELFAPSLRPFISSRAWNVWLLCVGIPTIALAVVTFLGHQARSVEKLDSERTRLALAAFAIALILGSTDVLTPLAPVAALG